MWKGPVHTQRRKRPAATATREHGGEGRGEEDSPQKVSPGAGKHPGRPPPGESAQRHRQQEEGGRGAANTQPTASPHLRKPGSLYFKREKVSMTQRKICTFS